MSAIAGIWNLDGRPVEDDLTHLSAPLAHGRYETDARWTEGPVGLACRELCVNAEPTSDTQPAVHGSGAVLVFDGRLDNREELLDTLAPAPGLSRDAPDAMFVLAAYAKFARAFPERLLGDFALALYDPARRELLLARDALGLRPLYFWRSPKTFLLASTIKSLLAHPAVPVRPNDAVLARFVTGQVKDDDRWSTCFHGVSTLPPAHLAIVAPQQFVTRQYWDFEPGRRVHLRGMGEYVEAYRHYFNQAVERQLRSAHPVGVQLSGGVDSSSVYCAAETMRRGRTKHFPGLVALSYVHTDHSLADETAYLRDIEQKFGISVECLPNAPPSAIRDSAREQVWHSEVPFVSVQWPNLTALLDRAYGLGARTLLSGNGADELLGNEAYLIDLFRRLRWYRVWSDLREIPRWFTDAERGIFRRLFFLNLIKSHVPSPVLDAYRRVRARAFRPAIVPPWYSTSFRTHGEVLTDRHSVGRRFSSAYEASVYRFLRSPVLSNSNDWSAKVNGTYGLEHRVPFLDRDLVAFVLAIPGEVQTWKGVPKSLIRDGMRSVLPESIAGRRWKGDYTQQANDGVNENLPWLLDMLRSGGLAEEFGYIDGKRAVDELVRQHPIRSELWAGSGAWGLLGLELWLQVFFGDRNEHRAQQDAPGGRP